ncbi:MAG: hypothetical protein ACPG8V_04645 [Alphaproteobacteria bacterium]
MTNTLFDEINNNPYEMGVKLGKQLFDLHSGSVDVSNANSNRLIDFHDKCHNLIFAGNVAPRIGAVQTTYVWQFIIQYLYELENLNTVCNVIGNIDTKSDNELSDNTTIGDGLADLGALLRHNNNADFIKGIEQSYENLPKNWVRVSQILDLYWWLNTLDKMKKDDTNKQNHIAQMLNIFKQMGAGNKDKFTYDVDTTALLQDRKK